MTFVIHWSLPTFLLQLAELINEVPSFWPHRIAPSFLLCLTHSIQEKDFFKSALKQLGPIR